MGALWATGMPHCCCMTRLGGAGGQLKRDRRGGYLRPCAEWDSDGVYTGYRLCDAQPHPQLGRTCVPKSIFYAHGPSN
eukprot:5218341-Pyramimonas_sp.AAC.1